MNSSNDRPIMATADDAIVAKQAAVDAGYYDDPFLQPFALQSQKSRPRRQVQPIIKRGTHARVCVMDRAISAFLNTNAGNKRCCQIVVLGAGKDTSYFKHCTQSLRGHQRQPDQEGVPPSIQETFVNWYEVDREPVIQEKAKIIQSTQLLSSQASLVPTQFGFQAKHRNNSSTLSLIQHDLREANLLDKLDLDLSLPTLLLIECVFMYLPSKASGALLSHFATQPFQFAYMVAYEPILGQDPFGRMMEQNLKMAGVASLDSSLLQDRTLTDQLYKWIQAGFTKAVACDMWSAYETILTPQQRRRANQSEFLDEVEEWMLIMRHYCFLAARIGEVESDAMDLTLVGEASPLGFAIGKCEVKSKT